jgi:hypothetical protein
MYLQSNIEVTYNDPKSIAGQATGIVRGVLGSVSILPTEDGTQFNKLQANFAYTTEEGVVIHNNMFETSGEEMEQLWQVVKPNVPVDATYQITEMTKYYIAFSIVMAQTFGISTDDISIVS